MKTISESAMPTGSRSTDLVVWGEESSTITTCGNSVSVCSGKFSTSEWVGAAVGAAGETVGRITEIQGILIVALLLEQRL